jgi:hypothetical protein
MLAVAMVVTSLARVASADVAPPPKANECNLLPMGSPCWVGRERGVCDENPDRRERAAKVCRLGVTVKTERDASAGDDGGGTDAGRPETGRGRGCATSACSAPARETAWFAVPLGLLLLRVLSRRATRPRGDDHRTQSA